MNKNLATSFKWKIKNLWDFYDPDNDEHSTTSEPFEIPGLPSVKWVLFYDLNGSKLCEDAQFGVILHESDNEEPLRVKVKMWIEDRFGKKLPERNIRRQMFQYVGDSCVFTVKRKQFGCKALYDAYDNRRGVTFWCELELLSPTVHFRSPYEFRQNFFDQIKAGREGYVIIEVGSRRCKVITAVLTSQCEEFEKMLPPPPDPKEGLVIKIKDTDVETVECFIKWIYLGVIEPKDLAEKLYVFASKYSIQDLKDQCVDLLIDTLNDGNMIDRFAFSVKFGIEKLREAAVTFIAPSLYVLFELFQTREWLNFEKKNTELAQQIKDELYDSV